MTTVCGGCKHKGMCSYRKMSASPRPHAAHRNFVCAGCGTICYRHRSSRFCFFCVFERPRRNYGYLPAVIRALTAVAKAVKTNVLLPPTAFYCVDCGSPAKHYDHRDYLKPLDVDPVCVRCNKLRGPGENKHIPAERVVDVERVTGIPRHELRPDLYNDRGAA